MTLEPYDADRLDQTALRILDIAAVLRQIAEALRREPEVELAIHDRKAGQWLANLEQWVAESKARLEMALLKRLGSKRAEDFSQNK